MAEVADIPARRAALAYGAEFTVALLDPGRDTPAIVSGPRKKSAARRYDVYRNNVTVSLVNALADIFPAVRRIVGEEFFRAMARLHVRKHPPASPLLFEYGREFPDFIAGFEHARPLPYLADVARIERAWLDAYHAADAAPLAPDALAAVPPEMLGDLRFDPHPAAAILRCATPAVTIFAMNRADGPVESPPSWDGEDALVTRPGLDVEVRHLPAGGAAFLLSLMAGGSLAEAVTAALDDSAQFDPAANIAGMLQAGVFAAIRPADGSRRGTENGAG